MVSVPTIQTIGIKLSDDRNRSIDLNGLHFQMSIKISYIHKEVLRKPPPRRYANPLVEERNQKLTEKRTKKKK